MRPKRLHENASVEARCHALRGVVVTPRLGVPKSTFLLSVPRGCPEDYFHRPIGLGNNRSASSEFKKGTATCWPFLIQINAPFWSLPTIASMKPREEQFPDKDNLATSKSSRLEEARQIIEEYVESLRQIIRKLRRHLN
jgi:hypothetical protein